MDAILAGTAAEPCAIRYRFDGPGPAALVVDCGGALRVYCRGTLSAPLSGPTLAAMLAGPRSRWVASAGELALLAVPAAARQPLPDPDADLSDTA